jgi:membrane-bound lytic murein transglycosylase B
VGRVAVPCDPIFVKVIAIVFAALLVSTQEPAAPASPPEPFEPWLATLMSEARDRGFDERVINQTLSGLEPLPRVVQSDRNQAELVMTLDRYVSSRVTPATIRRGREMAKTHAALLRRLESTYGVPRQYLLAVWGMESVGSSAGHRSSRRSPHWPGSRAARTSFALSSSMPCAWSSAVTSMHRG